MKTNRTREVQWFVDILKNDFGIVIEANEIGVEATELEINEVEDFFVPREVFDVLPNTLVYEIMIVDDEKSNVWIGAIGFYPNSPEWCLEVVTKNDELVLRNVKKNF